MWMQSGQPHGLPMPHVLPLFQQVWNHRIIMVVISGVKDGSLMSYGVSGEGGEGVIDVSNNIRRVDI